MPQTIRRRGLKAGSRLLKETFPPPATKQFLEPHLHPRKTLIGLTDHKAVLRTSEPLRSAKILRHARKKLPLKQSL